MTRRRWKVGELAKAAGLTVRTLRYYDQIGLFSPSGRTESGHRQYTEDDFARLQQLLSLKELGLTLEQAKSAFSGERFSPRDVVALQIEQLRQKIRSQQKLLAEFENVLYLMDAERTLSIEDLTKLMGAMKMSHESFAIERRIGWERRFDLLGDFLTEPKTGGEA